MEDLSDPVDLFGRDEDANFTYEGLDFSNISYDYEIWNCSLVSGKASPCQGLGYCFPMESPMDFYYPWKVRLNYRPLRLIDYFWQIYFEKFT